MIINNIFEGKNRIKEEINDIELKECEWCHDIITVKMVVDKKVYYIQNKGVICPKCINKVEKELLKSRK